jgi:hypothetical protein
VRANEKRFWALGDALEEIGPSDSPHRVRCEPGYPEHLADLITELEMQHRRRWHGGRSSQDSRSAVACPAAALLARAN